MTTIFRHANITYDNIDELSVLAYTPDYLSKMAVKISTTPKRVLANYLLWRITMNRASNLPKALQEMDTAFEKVKSFHNSKL